MAPVAVEEKTTQKNPVHGNTVQDKTTHNKTVQNTATTRGPHKRRSSRDIDAGRIHDKLEP